MMKDNENKQTMMDHFDKWFTEKRRPKYVTESYDTIKQAFVLGVGVGVKFADKALEEREK